jgi:predicted  nucleic acid-binding Zn-ribbon protein
MAEDGARHEAMVEFLGTFTTLSSAPPETLTDLSDGVALFEALSEIAPDYFDPTTIARQLGDNWALKSSNLRKFLRNLEHYYHEGLGKDADFTLVNVSSIAKQSDVKSIVVLVELVMAAAVTCEEKGTYVARMMQMNANLAMKDILETSLARVSDFDAQDSDMDENELVFDGQEDADGMDERADDTNLFGANHLQQSEALDDARREISTLKSQAAMMAEDNEKSQGKLRALVEDLQDRLVSRQDQLIQVEEELQKATSDLEQTMSELGAMASVKTQLEDDLDVANAKAAQLYKAEATLMAYKKKMESVGAMNQQMTDLEDQAASYLRQIVDLENEVKKSASLEKTVTDLREEIARMEKKHTQVESRSTSSASEIAALKSRVEAAESARKLFEEELVDLRAQQEHALNSSVEAINLNESSAQAPNSSSAEHREKLTRLEIENETLQRKVQALEAAAAASIEIAEEAAKTSQRVSEVQKTPTTETMSAADIGKIRDLEDSLAKAMAKLELKEQENNKISSDKDKLEAYTKRTLAKFQDKYLVALQECKTKLKEKQDKIEILEQRSNSERTAQKREERLLSSTIFELGLAIMQNRLKER